MSYVHLDEAILNEYLDGALEPDSLRRIETHLAGCSDCSAAFAELRKLSIDLAQLPDLPLQRDLAPAIIAAIRPHSPQRRVWRFALIAQLALALLLIMLFRPAGVQGLEALASSGFGEQAVHLLETVWTLVDPPRVPQVPALPSIGWWPELPFDQLQTVTWRQFLICAALLWLFGNALLLQPSQLAKAISPTRRKL